MNPTKGSAGGDRGTFAPIAPAAEEGIPDKPLEGFRQLPAVGEQHSEVDQQASALAAMLLAMRDLAAQAIAGDAPWLDRRALGQFCARSDASQYLELDAFYN